MAEHLWLCRICGRLIVVGRGPVQVEVAAVQLRPALDRRPGYAGPVHPGWTRYLVAGGARVG